MSLVLHPPMKIHSHGNKGHSHSHAGCFPFLPIPIPNFVINSHYHGIPNGKGNPMVIPIPIGNPIPTVISTWKHLCNSTAIPC